MVVPLNKSWTDSDTDAGNTVKQDTVIDLMGKTVSSYRLYSISQSLKAWMLKYIFVPFSESVFITKWTTSFQVKYKAPHFVGLFPLGGLHASPSSYSVLYETLSFTTMVSQQIVLERLKMSYLNSLNEENSSREQHIILG